jgi:ribonuclease HI
MKNYKCYFDGACEPSNPGGDMGMGIFITNGEQEYRLGKSIPANPSNTNNIAEYTALIMILKLLSNKQGCKIEIFGDSMMVIRQMKGEWQAKSGAYKDSYLEAVRLRDILKKANDVTFDWIPRDKNEIADYESIKALGFKRTIR